MTQATTESPAQSSSTGTATDESGMTAAQSRALAPYTGSPFDRITDVSQFVVGFGKAISESKMFGCSNVAQGQVLAMACLAERTNPININRRYHLIGGKLSMRADAMLAEFRAKGGKHKVLQRTSDVAEVELTYDGNKERFKFTTEEAKLEPFFWAKRDVPKDNYATPRGRMQMLWARVISDGVRTMCPEVVAGCYTPEDMGHESEPGDVVVDAEFTVSPSSDPAPTSTPTTAATPTPATTATTTQARTAALITPAFDWRHEYHRVGVIFNGRENAGGWLECSSFEGAITAYVNKNSGYFMDPKIGQQPISFPAFLERYFAYEVSGVAERYLADRFAGRDAGFPPLREQYRPKQQTTESATTATEQPPFDADVSVPPITVEQGQQVKQLLTDLGMPTDVFKKLLAQNYKVGTIRDLSQERADVLIGKLRDRLEKERMNKEMNNWANGVAAGTAIGQGATGPN